MIIRHFGHPPSDVPPDKLKAGLLQNPQVCTNITWSRHGKKLFDYVKSLVQVETMIILLSSSSKILDLNYIFHKLDISRISKVQTKTYKEFLLTEYQENCVKKDSILIEGMRPKSQTSIWRGGLMKLFQDNSDEIIHDLRHHLARRFSFHLSCIESKIYSKLKLLYASTDSNYNDRISSHPIHLPYLHSRASILYNDNDYTSIVFGLALLLKIPHKFYSSQGTNEATSSIRVVFDVNNISNNPNQNRSKFMSLYNICIQYFSLPETRSIDVEMIECLMYLYLASRYITEKLSEDFSCSNEKSHDVFWKQVSQIFPTSVVSMINTDVFNNVVYKIKLAYVNYTIAMKTMDLSCLQFPQVCASISPVMTVQEGLQYLASHSTSLQSVNVTQATYTALSHITTCSSDGAVISNNITAYDAKAIDSATSATVNTNNTTKHKCDECHHVPSLPSVFQSVQHLKVLLDAVAWCEKVDLQINLLKIPNTANTNTTSDRRVEAIIRIKGLLLLLRQVCTSVNLCYATIDYDNISSHVYLNLCFAGQSLSWKGEDIVNGIHTEFENAKLYHLYPLWQIAKGLMRLTSALSREAKACKRMGYDDIASNTFKICIEISKLLLWESSDFKYPGKFMELLELRSKRLASSSLHTDEHWIPKSLGTLNQNNCFEYAFDVLVSARGFFYERLLTDICNTGFYDQQVVTDLFEKSIDDPGLTKEYKVSLIERKSQLFKQISSKRPFHDISTNSNGNSNNYSHSQDSDLSPNKNMLRSDALGGLAAGHSLTIDEIIKLHHVEKISSNSNKFIPVRYIFADPIPNQHAAVRRQMPASTADVEFSENKNDIEQETADNETSHYYKKPTRLWFPVPSWHSTSLSSHSMEASPLACNKQAIAIESKTDSTTEIQNSSFTNAQSNLSSDSLPQVHIDYEWSGLHLNIHSHSHSHSDSDINMSMLLHDSFKPPGMSYVSENVESISNTWTSAVNNSISSTQLTSPRNSSSSGHMKMNMLNMNLGDDSDTDNQPQLRKLVTLPHGIVKMRMKDKNKVNALHSCSENCNNLEESISPIFPTVTSTATSSINNPNSADVIMNKNNQIDTSSILLNSNISETVTPGVAACVDNTSAHNIIHPLSSPAVANTGSGGTGFASGVAYCNLMHSTVHATAPVTSSSFQSPSNNNSDSDTTRKNTLHSGEYNLFSHYNECIVASWSESRYWLSLLFLLFWEEIYDDCIPYSKSRPWMNRPCDLYPEGYGNIFQYHNSMFYKRRKNRIENWAREMSSWSSIEMKRQVCLAFETYKDIPCFGINWAKANSIELASLAVAIGGKRLSHICTAILSDFESYYRGMPDLIFWKIDDIFYDKVSQHNISPTSTSMSSVASACTSAMSHMNDTVLVVEVKSNHDTLSKWQILWLELLNEAKIPIEICKQMPCALRRE